MRIVVNGQQAFGKEVLEALLKRGEEIVAVYGPPHGEGKPDPLIQAATDHGLPIYQPPSFKTEAAVEELRALEPDLGVMAFVTKIVPSTFLNVPTHGTIQYHPSLLPKHRGPSSINWPIIQGETETGLTIFWPDDGLDTGPILLQKKVEIGPDDTLGSVYFDKLFPLGIEAMLEAVDLVRDGTAPRIEQDESEATYEGWCRQDDVEIDWSCPAREVYNLIRGANPQPGAWTVLDGKALQIYDSRMAESAGSPAGTVTSVSGEGATVAAGDGAVLIQRVRPKGEGKIPVAELAETGAIREGMVLGR